MGYYTHFKIVLGNVEQENKKQIIEDLEKYCPGLVSLLKCEFREGYEYDDITAKQGEYLSGKWYIKEGKTEHHRAEFPTSTLW